MKRREWWAKHKDRWSKADDEVDGDVNPLPSKDDQDGPDKDGPDGGSGSAGDAPPAILVG